MNAAATTKPGYQRSGVHVASTIVSLADQHVWVSTVRLPFEHPGGMWYETMAFACDADGKPETMLEIECWRYESAGEAATGHDAAVADLDAIFPRAAATRGRCGMNTPTTDTKFWDHAHTAELNETVESILAELEELIVSELQAAAEGARLFGQDPGVWVHERANVIERLIRDTSQVNR